MNHLMIYEAYDIISHLKERGIDTDKTRVVIDDQSQDIYFFLYNLSGQMVGYQKYNPNHPKTGQSNLDDPRMTKYYNYVGEEGYGKKIAVWGLESFDFEDEFLFVTEGIFDIARVHESGYPGVAVLCNDPSDSLKSWLKTLPQKKIVICDNDKAGIKLKEVGDYSFSVKQGKDLNDLSREEAKVFLDDIVRSIGQNHVINESFSGYYKKVDIDELREYKDVKFDEVIFSRLQKVLYKNKCEDIDIKYSFVQFNTDYCGVDISMTNDEWFKVSVLYFSGHFVGPITKGREYKGQQHYYLCDQYEGLLIFLKEVIDIKIDDIFESKSDSLFLAEKGNKKLIVSGEELSDKNEILNKLNNSGFNLGSGHEEINISKQGDNYIMELVPYFGHPGQSVRFYKIK